MGLHFGSSLFALCFLVLKNLVSLSFYCYHATMSSSSGDPLALANDFDDPMAVDGSGGTETLETTGADSLNTQNSTAHGDDHNMSRVDEPPFGNIRRCDWPCGHYQGGYYRTNAISV